MWKRVSVDKYKNHEGYEVYVESQMENEYETGKYELNIYLVKGGYWETLDVYATFDQAVAAMDQWVKDNPNF